jgi:hypothetical protein
MSIYFIATRVTPLPNNPLAPKVERALVYFWIDDVSQEKSMERAKDYLASYRWDLVGVDNGPVETTAADFADQEEGLKGFWKAKQKGLAAHFVAKPRSEQPPTGDQV